MSNSCVRNTASEMIPGEAVCVIEEPVFGKSHIPGYARTLFWL